MENCVNDQVLVNILWEIAKAKESLRENTGKLAKILKRQYEMGKLLTVNGMRAGNPSDNLICLYDNNNVPHITLYMNVTDVVITKGE